MIDVLRRHPLITAVLVSLFLHLLLVWDGQFDLPDLFHPEHEDEVLAKKKASMVPRVRLTIKPPPRPKAIPGGLVVGLLEPVSAVPDKPATPKSLPKHEHPAVPKKDTPRVASQPVASSAVADTRPPETSQPAQPPDAMPAIVDNTPPAAASVEPIAPKNEPPPAFPVELHARYKTSIMGIGFDFQQTWRMEGYDYSIENAASKMGVKFLISSEGSISPSGGIKPNEFRLYINKKLQRFATFDHNAQVVKYGRPDNPRLSVMNEGIQDPFSLAYQLAVSFNGEPQIIQFTTGTSLFTVRLALEGEEMLKLPVGIIRTLHVKGRSVDTAAFKVDVWLAPDYRNFPVKVRVFRKGDNIDMSLRSLSFEGQQIIGKNLAPEPEDENTLPKDWLDRPEFQEYKPAGPSGLPGPDAP